jgi:hypothetical protein
MAGHEMLFTVEVDRIVDELAIVGKLVERRYAKAV